MLNTSFINNKSWIRRVGTRYLMILGGCLIVSFVGASYRYVIPQPKVIVPSGPALGVTQFSNLKPITIIFDHPVDKQALRYAITPELKGSWAINANLISATSALTFTPTESPELDTRYTISLSGITSLWGGKSEQYLLSFQTAAIPKLTAVTPAEGAVEVLPDTPITLTFDAPLHDGLQITASLTPEVVLEQLAIDENKITFNHTTPLVKGTTYTLKAFLSTVKVDYATNTKMVSDEAQEINATTFTTMVAPGIGTYLPIGTGVDPATAIQAVFKQPMDRASAEAAFSIAPTVVGTYSWSNDQTMVFTPSQKLTHDQHYSVTIATTATAISGYTLEEPFTWSFTTLGAVIVTSVTPTKGATGIDTASGIGVTFNQEVVPASAESKFSITPVVEGTFSWSGQKLVFQPQSALAYSQTYTISIAAGVQSVKGADSIADWTTTFTTRSQSVMLSVPSYRQAHMYSCMITAARNALAFRGVSASEASIIARVGMQTTAWSGTWGKDGAVWGDPDVGLVGGLDNSAATAKSGSTSKVTWGYGSHWAPIASVLSSYGVANEVRTGMSVQDVAQSIADGKPVIIWWVNGIWPSYVVNWKTPSGKSVRGVNGLHVQVVRGFTGTVDNPTTFTVTDSGYGFPGHTFDVGTFKVKWNWFGNTGIIVK